MDGGDLPLRQKLPVAFFQPDTVGGDAAVVEDVMAVQHLGRGQAVLLLAALVLVLRLGEVDVHGKIVVVSILGDGLPEGIRGGVLGVDGGVHLDTAVVEVVPLLMEGYHLAAALVRFKVEVVLVKEQSAPGDIGLDAALGHGLGDLVAEVVHLRDGGDAKAQALGDGELGGSLDAAAVEPVLPGEDAVVQPLVEGQVVAIAPEDGHGQVDVAVDEARHQHHAGAVHDGLGPFLGSLFGKIADLAVGDADEGVQQDAHLLVHGDDGDIGE